MKRRGLGYSTSSGVILDMIETGYARRATVYQLTDKFYAAGCSRRWEKR